MNEQDDIRPGRLRPTEGAGGTISIFSTDLVADNESLRSALKEAREALVRTTGHLFAVSVGYALADSAAQDIDAAKGALEKIDSVLGEK